MYVKNTYGKFINSEKNPFAQFRSQRGQDSFFQQLIAGVNVVLTELNNKLIFFTRNAHRKIFAGINSDQE